MRRWFFSRPADHGFAIDGFPRTCRQALVFDEWLEARGESLDACLLPAGAIMEDAVVAHYRDHGLLIGLPAALST